MTSSYRIALIIDYFGTWPEWIDLFFHSCKLNSTVHFFLITDCETRDEYATNIHFIKTTFSDYKSFISDKLNICFNPDYPYKLCDIRPFYGHLHQEILKDFDFYGHADLDLVFGNIREFITNNLLSQFNVISTHRDRISGHFALFKNNEHNINCPFKIKNWKDKLENNKRVSVDERYHAAAHIPFLEKLLLIKKALKWLIGIERFILINIFILKIYKKFRWYKNKKIFFEEMFTTPFTYSPWLDGTLHDKQPDTWYYKNGIITNKHNGDHRFMYLHFMNFKSGKFRKDKTQLWNGKFYNLKTDDINCGVLINPKGISPLHKN